MYCKNRKNSFVALMSAFVFVACGGDVANEKPKPDAAGFPDAAPPLSMMDSGVVTDTDAGVSGACPANFAGCRCTPIDPDPMAEPDQGSCVDVTSICLPYDDEQQLAICVYTCESDADCAGKIVGNPMDNKAAVVCDEIGINNVGICVQTEKTDDERCRLHALAGRTMEGCRDEAQCNPVAEGDSPGEGACLQFCTPSPQDPTGGCSGDYPFCNPRLGQNQNIGVCSDKQRGVGAKCGGGITKVCDTTNNTATSNVMCFSNDILDPNGTQPLFPTMGLEEGFCVETCDPDLPSCPQTTDPSLGTGTCKSLGTGSQGKLGLCSNECNTLDKLRSEDEIAWSVPVSACTGTGGGNTGTNCFAFPPLTINSMDGIFGQVDVCLDVLTPTIAESALEAVLVSETSTTNLRYNPRPKTGTNPVDCVGTREAGEAFTCPPGTYCQNIGSPQTAIYGCVRRCTTQSSTVAPTTPQFEINECAESTLPDQMNLVCVPLALTTTITLGGGAPGFCAETP